MDEGREGIWFSGNGRGKSAEFFREERRRTGCGDWAEMVASLRDVKESLRHSLLLSLLPGIGRRRGGEQRKAQMEEKKPDSGITLALIPHWFALDCLLALVWFCHSGSLTLAPLIERNEWEAYIRSCCCWARAGNSNSTGDYCSGGDGATGSGFGAEMEETAGCCRLK